MPLDPSTWAAGPLTASQLNVDLYNYLPGNNHCANGILFHSMPPLYYSWNWKMTSNIGSGASAVFTSLAGTEGNWFALADTQTRIAPASNQGYGGQANGNFLCYTPGADGSPSGPNGNFLVFGQVVWGPQTNTTGYAACSVGSNNGGSTTQYAMGNAYRPSTTQNNMGFVLDLRGGATATQMFLNAICEDSSGSGFPLRANANSPSSETCRIGVLWCGMGNAVETPPTVTSVPVVPSFTSVSGITSTIMNNDVRNSLRLLNNPPQFRAQSSQTGAIGASHVTIQYSSVSYNNYGANWNSGTWTYTVPLDGVYLVHVTTETNNTTGRWRVGVTINGSLIITGPAYDANALTRPTFTRLLDLKAGDTLVGWVSNSASSPTLTGSASGKLLIKWMAGLPSGSLAWTPPDAGFRWAAGTPAAQLPGLFNQHITNDLNFLMWRPYLLAYQSTAQTGLAQNTSINIVMDTVSGKVHGSPGDPYGGWNASGSPVAYWAAPIPGWYLLIQGVFQSSPATIPATCVVSTQTANAAGTSLGLYTFQKMSANTADMSPGGEGIGLIYLAAGDRVFPVYQEIAGGTYSTTVNSETSSHFGLVWVSE